MHLKSLLLMGINHLIAPIPCRERTAVLDAEAPEALAQLMGSADLEEAVLISTCSRVEVVAAARDPELAAARLEEWFLSRSKTDFGPSLYLKRGPEAVLHLFRVTAGLDSWIVGESEIQGQMKRAYQLSFERRLTGRVLNRVFQSALSAGKSIRAETGLQNGIHSIGGAAALLARRIFDEAERGRVIVFGAGKAAESVTRHLAAKNFKDIWVANRTLERARELAEPLGGLAMTFDEGIGKLAEAEAAIFSTSCPKALLDPSILAPRLKGRKRPLFVIDLGLPRNVEPACAKLPGVYLYNLDDLKEIVRESMARKSAEKISAEALAAQGAGACVRELEKAESGMMRETAGRLVCWPRTA